MLNVASLLLREAVIVSAAQDPGLLIFVSRPGCEDQVKMCGGPFVPDRSPNNFLHARARRLLSLSSEAVYGTLQNFTVPLLGPSPCCTCYTFTIKNLLKPD